MLLGRAAFRVLRNSHEIDSARKILYQVYIEELGWNPRPDNPSGFHVRQLASGEKMLCDHFDDDAVWIGTYKGQELAGVSRILTRENKLGKLDVELYDSRKKLSTLSKEPCVEVQRYAAAKQYRGNHNMAPEMLLFTLGFAKTRSSSVLGSSNVKYVQTLMEGVGFECIDDNFLYGEEGEVPTLIYLLSLHKFEYALKKLKDLGIK